ncbi:MAG TPA: DegT/DnrJ/EryC1/StrS family aminotransferase [Candidatus Obscuribacterales bacterium]
MSQHIPIFSLTEQYPQIQEDVERAVISVLRSGNYILGEHGKKLESEIARLCGCSHGIGVANGTDALHLALWALDIGPGDEVLTTPFTFAATVEAIAMVGARPVFVDIDPTTFNIDPHLLEKRITPKSKAIIPVHLYGRAADMDPIMAIADRFALKVIEDNAQAIGATYKNQPTGSFGDLACISFYPTKNLGACGDAGMIVTNDDRLAQRLKALRAHGMRRRYYHDELGVNSRLDEIQAAVLLTKLAHLATWTAQREAVAKLYADALKHTPGIILPNNSSATHDAASKHVWHQYTIRIQHGQVSGEPTRLLRDTVADALNKEGIGSMCYYPLPLHLQEAFNHYGYGAGDFPISEQLANEVLSLPMYPELTKEQVEKVARSLTRIMCEQLQVAAPVSAPTFTT